MYGEPGALSDIDEMHGRQCEILMNLIPDITSPNTVVKMCVHNSHTQRLFFLYNQPFIDLKTGHLFILYPSLYSPLTSIKWNGTGGELSSCVINTSIRSCIIIFGTLSEQIYQLTFYPFLFYVLIYICLCFLCIVVCMHSFHSAHVFKVCNSVI